MKRRIFFVVLGVLVAVGLTATVALAGHPVFDASKAPSGTHVQSGTPGCSVVGLTITCASFEVAGVGNANAQADLTASYSATVDCTNKGGKLVPVKSQGVPAGDSSGQIEPKNGRLTVPQLSVSAPSTQAFLDAAICPNGNWTKSLAPGDPTLDSFTYTVTFAGFAPAWLTITSPH